MQKIILGCLALFSLMDYLRAEMVYAAVSGLPTSFLPPPPPPPFAGNGLHSLRPPLLHNDQLVRPQRSLYGPPIHGWNGPPVHSNSIGLGHISKQELITLLEAAKEAVKPEPAAEPEPEPEPQQEPAPGQGAENGGGPPPGVPLTVSLPAFVPIQLSAMYTAPAPPAAPEGGAGGGGGGNAEEPEEEEGGDEGEEEEGGEEEDEEEEEEGEEEESEVEAGPGPGPAPGPIKPYPIYQPWSSRGVYTRTFAPFASPPAKKSKVRAKSTRTKSKTRSKSGKSKSRKAKSKSRSKKRTTRKPSAARNNNLRFASSAQNIQVLPPPPFLARAPGPLKLVPSNQLLSNWK